MGGQPDGQTGRSSLVVSPEVFAQLDDVFVCLLVIAVDRTGMSASGGQGPCLSHSWQCPRPSTVPST